MTEDTLHHTDDAEDAGHICIVCLVNAAIEGWQDQRRCFPRIPEQYVRTENRRAYGLGYDRRMAMDLAERGHKTERAA